MGVLYRFRLWHIIDLLLIFKLFLVKLILSWRVYIAGSSHAIRILNLVARFTRRNILMI